MMVCSIGGMGHRRASGCLEFWQIMVSLGSVILKPYFVKVAELSLFVKSASEWRERARSESLKIFIRWVSVSLNEREVVPTE